MEAPRGLRATPFSLPDVRNSLEHAPLSAREEDSVRRELATSLARLARERRPTVAERDSLMGVAARAATIPGRPAQAGRSMGGGIAFPLFSPGPSPAERRRDSIGNAEYVARLRRLQDRVRLRNDSVRIADSSSRRGVPE